MLINGKITPKGEFAPESPGRLSLRQVSSPFVFTSFREFAKEAREIRMGSKGFREQRGELLSEIP